MQDIDQLIQSDKPWAAQRAQMALAIMNQAQMGQISRDEARELLEDLVRTDALEAEADDMQTKAMLVTAIYGFTQILSAV